MTTFLLIFAAATVSGLIAGIGAGFATFRATPWLIARLPVEERLTFARKVSAHVEARKVVASVETVKEPSL